MPLTVLFTLIFAILAALLALLCIWSVHRLKSTIDTNQAHNQTIPQTLLEQRLAFEKELAGQKLDFREVALQHFQSLHQTVQQTLGQQSTSLEQRFEALQRQNSSHLETLRASVEQKLAQNIEQNFGAFKEMSQSLSLLKSSADQMLQISHQVSDLNRILASPKLQGNFGEAALEKLLADILPQNAFELQPRLAEGCQPDATLHMQGKRLCIDSKFPKDRISALLAANPSQDSKATESARKEFVKVIREMVADIAKKYIRPELGTVDQALLFVPSESLYFEILSTPELTEICRKVRVTPVSPNTLAATLYAVAMAFRGYQMEQNARALIESISKMAHHFENFQKDFTGVGTRIRQAQEDYAKASRDLERLNQTMAQLKNGSSSNSSSSQNTPSHSSSNLSLTDL